MTTPPLRITEVDTTTAPPSREFILAKLLYRLWEASAATIPIDLDAEIVQALQPWASILRNAPISELPDV